MVKNGRALRMHIALAYAAALGFAGCVPIPKTVALSPTISGTFFRADSSPMAGERLVLSVEYSDSNCANPALHTTTDSAGRFDFPAFKKRERFTVVLFDRVLPYHICHGPAGTEPVYHDAFLLRVPEVYSLSCFEAAEASRAEGREFRCVAQVRRRRE